VVDVPELRTERLLLRGWRADDRAPFAALNADTDVMEHFVHRLTREESDAFVDRIEAAWASDGYGLWAVEPLVDYPRGCVGFVGLAAPRFDAHFTPAVEVGWRLDKAVWGRGYAPEGARAALDFAFDVLGLDEVVSMTTVENRKSRRVMEKLGMTRDPADDFDHPLVPEGHPIRPHVLYRLRRSDYQKS
jgi:RimJ/RimL family protein N-acetyltransferase